LIRLKTVDDEYISQKQFVLALAAQVIEKTAPLYTQANNLIDANKKLEVLTYEDGLTELYNRRYFDEKLTK
jgi:PleD family two-component response regulator